MLTQFDLQHVYKATPSPKCYQVVLIVKTATVMCDEDEDNHVTMVLPPLVKMKAMYHLHLAKLDFGTCDLDFKLISSWELCDVWCEQAFKPYRQHKHATKHKSVYHLVGGRYKFCKGISPNLYCTLYCTVKWSVIYRKTSFQCIWKRSYHAILPTNETSFHYTCTFLNGEDAANQRQRQVMSSKVV